MHWQNKFYATLFIFARISAPSNVMIIKKCLRFCFSLRSGVNGCQRLTLQQGRGRRHCLWNAVHAVDGLEEFWDAIVLIRDQHLNLWRWRRNRFLSINPWNQTIINSVTRIWEVASSGVFFFGFFLILFRTFSNSRVRNSTFHEHVCFSTKAPSRPPPCTLSVTAVCKVWSDSWVIVLK